ncbi:hypothetical protein Cni_G24304 [Canna indica]|uniref:Ubiquitin carboxyl-terminal hydrolase n=1 Tax=Canna indica TaxID=4628 RepID=A0AAQ3QN21_9LILI|nr:hypothetical protein Cni_G24304 [Canna indica]
MKYEKEVNMYHLIHKVKHGYKMLVANKTFCPFQYHLSVSILGLGIGMTSLYMMLRESNLDSFYLPWATEGKDLSEITYVAGLQNLGNNCFLNVVLQALASSSCFVHFLQNVLDTNVESIEESTTLLATLIKLLEDLSIIHDKRTILDPRRLMLAMSFYVSSFKLTKQQDAAEALLHLLSSLEEEILQCYVPHSSTLAEITSLPSRIHKPKSKALTECELWRSYICGPFDGTIGSILTCRSCSSVLSVDIQHFRSLPLSPVLDMNGDIIEDCSIMDCLAKFTEVEYLENYRCDRCWHIAALKYLSFTGDKDQEKIHKLNQCVKIDCCDCKSLFYQEEIKWPDFSCALKQLTLTRCPKILCIHLQRASMNGHGELIKLQGRISFPFILDLFPFTKVRKTLEEGIIAHTTRKFSNKNLEPLDPRLQLDKKILEHVYGRAGGNYLLKGFPMNNFPKATNELPVYSSKELIIEDTYNVSDNDNKMISVASNSHQILDKQVQPKASKDSTSSSMSSIYRLSSVVEHYGRYGSGHYAVYRRVTVKSDGGNSTSPLGTEQSRWFYVSDHEVYEVSIDTVFAAEASLLFYERIDGDSHIVT